MRKVFLDDLPRWGKGESNARKGTINWNESIGKKVKFIYDNVEGELEIVSYDAKRQCVVIKYLEEDLFQIQTGNIIKCKLGRVLGKTTGEFKYKIGQTFKDEKRDIIVVNREYRKIKNINYKYYCYKCNKCSYEGWVVESSLKQGTGCACCSSQVAVLGINTIWDTDRWMCDLGISEEDAKTHISQSNKKIKVICPDCGKNKTKVISDIYSKKSICCYCSNKRSYSEKFMTNVLNQLGVEFETQYSPNWSDKRFYDFYIPSLNMIIETHGIQHYEQTRRKNARSLEEEQENDRYKKKMALNNGIYKYVIVDCRYSEFDWITFNVYKSLKCHFNMVNIDFKEAERFALSNIVKEVCEYWNNKEDWETTQTIANNNPWGIKSAVTIASYLKKGTALGWCYYNPKKERSKCGYRINKQRWGNFKNPKCKGLYSNIHNNIA